MPRRKLAGLFLTVALLLAGGAMAQQNRQAEIDLQAAIRTETVTGDLKGAIKQYESLIARYPRDRALAANALIRMADVYQKLGDGQSRKIYERVVREYADQKDAAATARQRLSQAAETAALATRQVWPGRNVNLYGAPSPDGRFLTYTDWGPPALAIRELATGATIPLATGSWEDPMVFPNASRFSPNGRYVASTWFNEKRRYDLRVVPVTEGRASGAPRVLYSNEEVPYLHPAEWSPDGKSILVTLWRKDETAQIALINVEDGSATVLKSLGWRAPGELRFSPDGRFIAYDLRSDPNAGADIFVTATDGSRETTLVQEPSDDHLLGWAPDGKHILFSSDLTGTRDAWLIGVSEGRPSGQPQLVKRDIGRIQPMGFTKTGDFYYGLHAGIRDIYVGAIDPASGKVLEEPRIASQRFLGSNRAPSWSPDGENLAYFMAPGGSGRQPTSLIIRALKSGQERTLRRDLRPNLNIPPRWSPDGQWLLVNSRDERGRVGLHRINVETGAIVPVHENAFWGVWTPDAKSIILAPRGDERSIRIRDLDTGQEKELFRLVEPMYVSNLALSPDGRRLAFGMPGDIIGQIITILPLDGGTPKELMRVDILGGGQFAGLNWAPDGKHLYFSRSGQMWRIAADGGEPQPISLNANGSDGLSVHPDGRRIAFVSGEQKEEVWVMENLLPVPGK